MTNEELKDLLMEALDDLNGWTDGSVDPGDLETLDKLFAIGKEAAKQKLQLELDDPERLLLIKRLSVGALIAITILNADII